LNLQNPKEEEARQGPRAFLPKHQKGAKKRKKKAPPDSKAQDNQGNVKWQQTNQTAKLVGRRQTAVWGKGRGAGQQIPNTAT